METESRACGMASATESVRERLRKLRELYLRQRDELETDAERAEADRQLLRAMTRPTDRLKIERRVAADRAAARKRAADKRAKRKHRRRNRR